MNSKKKGSEEDRLCLVVGILWNGQGCEIYYPTIYKEESLEYIKHFPFYLTKAHGEKMKGEFLPHAQKIIEKTT